MNWQRVNRGDDLPDLGETCSWEWTRNTYSGTRQLIVGARQCGGLEAVLDLCRGSMYDKISFRCAVRF
jgi:hypothetical protein